MSKTITVQTLAGRSFDDDGDEVFERQDFDGFIFDGHDSPTYIKYLIQNSGFFEYIEDVRTLLKHIDGELYLTTEYTSSKNITDYESDTLIEYTIKLIWDDLSTFHVSKSHTDAIYDGSVFVDHLYCSIVPRNGNAEITVYPTIQKIRDEKLDDLDI